MYPYKYPDLYGELAKQGKTKKDLADVGLTVAGLRYNQSVNTSGDFSGSEMRKAAEFLGRSADYLFGFTFKSA